MVKIIEPEITAALARTSEQASIPDSVVGRLLNGENPIRVWPQYRSLSLRALAEQVAASPSALSDMETGKTQCRLSILHRIAGDLGVALAWRILFRPPDVRPGRTHIGTAVACLI